MWLNRKNESLRYIESGPDRIFSRRNIDRAVLQAEFVQASLGRDLRPPNRQKSTLKLSIGLSWGVHEQSSRGSTLTAEGWSRLS